MENHGEKLQCYNRGCGQKFSPDSNNEDSCCHHPGEPFFHDAYKGWSCCNRKCTDFTEFLNFKGCTKSKHSNIKPPEPEQPAKSASLLPDEIIEVKPIARSTRKRPPFDSPLVKMKPKLAPSLQNQVLETNSTDQTIKSNEIVIGTICKNSGCNASYEGVKTDETICTHHPGVPIFHEGLKFWSCCQKRTTDFDVFLKQIGCQQGKHVWVKENAENVIKCRWDYHQIATHVIVSIYAKQYCAQTSQIQLNPIRLKACLVFPQQAGAKFQLDFELQGIVDVENSEVSMYSTKVEIKLKKAEPGSWPRLEIPRATPDESGKPSAVAEITPKIDAVDLDDL